MGIQESSFEIRKPERVTGGRMGPLLVIDGEVGNLFTNYGTLSYWSGDIETRKAYAFVNSNAADLVIKGFLCLTKAPDNPHASAAIFSTRDWFDFTPSHNDYLTSYLSDGTLIFWFVLETARVNSKVITLWGRPGNSLPEIGLTYVLIGNAGLSTEYKQAITIAEIQSTESRTFYDVNTQSDITLSVVRVLLNSALRYNFIGPTPSKIFPTHASTQIVDTIYTGAVRVYSVANITDGTLAADSYVIPVDSIYTPIVPASTISTNLIDQTAANRTATLVAAGSQITQSYAGDFSPTVSLYLGMAAVQGSISITTDTVTLTDEAGVLYSGTTQIGTIDYENGIIRPVSNMPTYIGAKTIKFTPAGNTNGPLQTASIAITPANRRQTYTYTLPWKPTPGTVQVWWVAGNKLYKLTDNGNGSLSGSSSNLGSGDISALNTISVTLGFPPDAGTSVIFFFGTDTFTFMRAGATATPAAFEITTAQPFSRSSLLLSWTVNGTDYTAGDNGWYELTGDATGEVDYAAGKITFRPTIMVPKNTVLQVLVTKHPGTFETFNHNDVVSNGIANIALTFANIVPNTVSIVMKRLKTANVSYYYNNVSSGFTKVLQDNGSGVFPNGGDNATIDYTSGQILGVQASGTVSIMKPTYQTLTDRLWVGNYSAQQETAAFSSNTTFTVSYLYDNGTAETLSENHTLSTCVIDLVPQSGETAIPGSLLVEYIGVKFYEQSGAIYADVGLTSGSGIWAGSFDYQSRRITLTNWPTDGANAPVIKALLTRVGIDSLDEVTLRVPSAPIAPTGFTLRATQLDGTAITASDNGSGYIDSEFVTGKVSMSNGMVRARFGQYVPKAGNEGQFWYKVDNVVGDNVWQPLPVLADTVLYNATTLTKSTLSAEVIGIETERLPPSGEVEQFRDGDTAYIFHDTTLTVANPQAGGAIDCGRIQLERIWVTDATGMKVPATKYTANTAELDLGICHWVDPLTLTGYPTPWTVHHRISDGGTLAEVDLFGYLTLRDRPVRRDFPTGSKVSAVLYIGNMQADWGIPFFGATWPGYYSDTLIGSAAQWAYDFLNFPLVVTNQGATVKGRVAFIFETPLSGQTYSTTFKCQIEGTGIIATGQPITADFAPINPATDAPYFTIRGNNNGDLPWGTGQTAQSYMEFNLTPGNFPFEIVRCLQPSEQVTGTDSIRVEFHGNPNE